MKLRILYLIVFIISYCFPLNNLQAQSAMSFTLSKYSSLKDSVVFRAQAKVNSAASYQLHSIQFMITYDPTAMSIDSNTTIMNHKFAAIGWNSRSSAVYSNSNPADPDTLFYKEEAPGENDGITLPLFSPIDLCTISFYNDTIRPDIDDNLTLIGNSDKERQSGIFTTDGRYYPFQGIWGISVVGIAQPASNPTNSALHSCYPNPVSNAASTDITFSLVSASHARVTVANALGQTVARLEDGDFQAGTHTTSWSPQGLPPGTYFIVMETVGTTPQRFVRAVAVR